MLSKPVLEILDLHKKFKEIEVLKGVDLAMETGDVVSVIGSSGSGKTTMLRCVNLLEDFERRMPGRKDVMIRALGNVRSSHLLDPKLFDFAGLTAAKGGPDEP